MRGGPFADETKSCIIATALMVEVIDEGPLHTIIEKNPHKTETSGEG
jgi:hypothetical protein